MQLVKIIIVCFLAGAGAGIGTGFAGMSAAAVIGPMLATFLDIPAYQAVGIGLLSDVLASAVSAYTYHKHGNLDIRHSLVLMFCVLGTTAIGSFLASLLPEWSLNGGMQIAMIVIGLKFILFPVRRTREQLLDQERKKKHAKSVIGGCGVGLICGTVGAGGGIMLLFVLTQFLGYPLHMAVGTSVFIMAFTALTGGLSHVVIGGTPDLCALLFCVLFTFIWARIAAVLANRAEDKTLNRVVGIVMILTSVVILLVHYIL